MRPAHQSCRGKTGNLDVGARRSAGVVIRHCRRARRLVQGRRNEFQGDLDGSVGRWLGCSACGGDRDGFVGDAVRVGAL